MDDITSRIKKLRMEKNMSMSAFAENIGFSKAYLSMIESNDRAITDKFAAQIISKLDINEEWLLYGTGTPYNNEKAAMRNIHQQFFSVLYRNYPQTVMYCRSFLVPDKFEQVNGDGKGLSVLERFPALTLQGFYKADIEPKKLIEALVKLYKNLEIMVDKWLKVTLLLNSSEFKEFRNPNERYFIVEIESKLRSCRELIVNNRIMLERNADNNKILDIIGYYNFFHSQLPYKENIEIIELMQEKVKNRRECRVF